MNDSTAKQRTSLSTAKATSATQRPQTCREAATKYHNYTVNETDEEREHRLPTLPKATRLDQATLLIKFTVKITFFDAATGSNMFPTDSGQPISLYTMGNNGIYSKLHFTMNVQFRTPIMCDMFREALHL